ncbi:MAG: M12 family metallo-peptidase [Acidobacteria bacterium]|nr:M12 family metallo-peptidase [Acidobacteriota bacterium]
MKSVRLERWASPFVSVWISALVLAALGLPLRETGVFAQQGGMFGTVAQPEGVFVAVAPEFSRRPGALTGVDRLVRIDQDVLLDAFVAATAGDRPVLTLNLLDNIIYAAIVDQTALTSAGYSLSGHLDGVPEGSMTLVVNGDIVVGTVRTATATYAIHSIGGGIHVIQRSERSQLPTLGDDIMFVEPLSAEVDSDRAPAAASATSTPEDTALIDVLIVYTANGRSELGGPDEIKARIDHTIADINVAYADSGVFQRIRLVQTVEVDYVSEGYTSDDINRLEDPDDGFMDNVHTLRDQFGADLVHLLVPVSDAVGRRGKFDVGGRALLGPGADAAFSMCTMIQPDATNWLEWQARCTAHELGHNMGLRHDRWDNRNADLTTSYRPYSYGYVNQRALDAGAPESSFWRTIMSQGGQCEECVWLLRFSNPDQTYNGDPLGVPGSEHSSSVTGPADAERHLNETAAIVASNRASPCDGSGATERTCAARRLKELLEEAIRNLPKRSE